MSENETRLTEQTAPDSGSGTTPNESQESPTRAELIAELELLEEENQRLRESFVQAQQTKYRRAAIGLVALGLVATAGAVLFPAVRTVLLALGATGMFGGLLTYYLTPERFISARVGSDVYDALAASQEAITTELGLQDTRIYVPTGDARTRVKLFIPQHTDWELPDADSLESVFVVSEAAEQRGVAFHPTGGSLFDEFEQALDGPLGTTVEELIPQLRDGLIEQFELVGHIDVDSDAANGRLSVDFENPVYGSPDELNHPATSFLAVGLARGLEQAIHLDTPDSETTTITFRWDVSED